MDILVKHKDSLESITQALLEFETIDGSEVEMLVKGAALSEIQKVRNNKKSDSESALARLVDDSVDKNENITTSKSATAT
jgi:cell division protease FtsH